MDTIESAERALIGGVLHGTRIDDLRVEAADFANYRHQAFWRVIESVVREGRRPDMVTTAAEIPKLSKEDQRGLSGDWIHDLLIEVPIVANTANYARIVKDAARRRRVRETGVRTVQLADDNEPTDDVIELARKSLDDIAKSDVNEVKFMSETIDDTIDSLAEPATYFPTPWPALSHMIGGFRPGALYVVGARPGIGKTVIGLQCAIGLAHEGSVAFSSLEMTRAELEIRAIAQLCNVSLKEMGERRVSAYGWDMLAKYRSVLAELPISVDDTGAVTTTVIKSHARSTNRRKPLAGVVVDYIGLVKSTLTGTDRKRHEEVGQITRDLKTMAKELDVPVIALSQVNRASTTRVDGRPLISELRESGSIEQDADVVILLHRDLENEKDNLQLAVAKNRHGQTGGIELDWQGVYARATEKKWSPTASIERQSA